MLCRGYTGSESAAAAVAAFGSVVKLKGGLQREKKKRPERYESVRKAKCLIIVRKVTLSKTPLLFLYPSKHHNLSSSTYTAGKRCLRSGVDESQAQNEALFGGNRDV